MGTSNRVNKRKAESASELLAVVGIAIIVAAWLMFVLSMGVILNLWDWALLDSWKPVKWLLYQDAMHVAVRHYYVYIFFLNFVILWLWCVVSWISMKLFRHSKGGG